MKVSIISLTIALTSALVAANPDAPAPVRREPQIASQPHSLPSHPARVRREPQIASRPVPLPSGPAELPGCGKICLDKWLCYRRHMYHR
ncbi:hypothetical protein LX32DRAFT_691518 [Colletotrichum zoysiae]|uniref:Uncharacterized protein n=1 Tax=Colletotrichum zoysiae TaxID=1216348 RepID=A0AAD9HP80_9PEZI|nr:hypothetical protein LX32DRAFT_691518 [Colletotrichum zoysiae]